MAFWTAFDDQLAARNAWLGILSDRLVVLILFFIVLHHAAALRAKMRGRGVVLSKLRKDGVPIRNRGCEPIFDETIWLQWKKDVEDWNDRAIRTIEELDEGDAIWFSVLDAVPPPRVPWASLSQQQLPQTPEWELQRIKLYEWQDFRLQKLEELIKKRWDD